MKVVDIADGLAAGAVERDAGARQGGADDALEIVGVDADPLARIARAPSAGPRCSFSSRS